MRRRSFQSFINCSINKYLSHVPSVFLIETVGDGLDKRGVECKSLWVCKGRPTSEEGIKDG